MSDDTLVVLLHGVPIGVVRRRVGGRLEFRYDAAYAEGSDAVPLSLCMPVSRRTHPDRWIGPWLWGLLPDSGDVRREWANEYHVSANSAFELLSTPVGRDCAGAVQFCEPSAVNWLAERDGDLHPLSEYHVAERLRSLARDETAWLDSNLRLEFSLAGGQRKTALHFADGAWSVPRGGIPTTHILKPAIRGLRGSDINEHLCLTAARHLGLPAAQTTLGVFEDQTAVVVTRFDRRRIDGTVYRAHQEDLCQAFAVKPADKYENGVGPNASAGITILRQHAGEHAHNDITRFVDALAVNWLIGGTDAHGKNYSLLIDEHSVRLAPLYDVNSVLPYRAGRERSQELAMPVGGHDRLGEVTTHDWMVLAREARLDGDATIERVLSLAARLPEALASAAADPAVQAVDATFANQLVERVSWWVNECVPRIESANLPAETATRRTSTTVLPPTLTGGVVDSDGDPRLTPDDRRALLEVVKDDEYRQLLDTIPITIPNLDALS